LRSGAGSGPLRCKEDHAHAVGRPSRQPGRSVGLPARLATAPCVLHRLVTICGEGPTRPRYRAKARYPGPGGAGMKGTSGAADLGLLRGGSGEAALGPRRPRESGSRGHVVPKLSRVYVGGGGIARRDRRRRTVPARTGLVPGRQVTGTMRRAAPDSPSGAPRSRDRRCPSGSGRVKSGRRKPAGP